MITDLQLAEWKQMAAEAEACLRTEGKRMSYLGIDLLKSSLRKWRKAFLNS